MGRGMAKAVLKKGDRAVVTARDEKKVVDLIRDYPDTGLTLSLDVTDSSSIKAAAEAARRRFGQIDVLVNNAGFGYRAAIEESERETVDLLFRTHVFGPAELINHVLPEMRARRSGTIVNVSSIGAVRAAVGNGYYSASKAAMELASDALYKELKPLGIRVMMVEPGAFRTGFYGSLRGTGKVIDDYAETAGKWHVDKVTNAGDQPGDPDRAGEIIVDMLDRDDCPERLVMGSDAVRGITAELEARLAEVKRWSAVSFGSDFTE